MGYRDGSLQTEHRTITAVTRWVSQLEEALVCQCGRSNLKLSQSLGSISEKAAAPERIFTLLGPLLVGSQSDDFPAVAGALVADVTACGVKYSFWKRQKQDKTMQLMRNERAHKAAFKWRTSPHLFYCLLCGRLRSPRPFAV